MKVNVKWKLIVRIPPKVDVLMDDEAVNEDALFYDPGISNDVSVELEVHDDKLSSIED